MEPPTKKRKVLTLEERADIIRAVASGQKSCCRARLPSTLSTILKSKDAIISATTDTTLSATSPGHPSKKKNLKTTPHEKLEALFTWFMDMRAENVPLTGDVVQQKARTFACLLGYDEFKANRSWLSQFQECYGIVGKVLSQESPSVNKVGADELREVRTSTPDKVHAGEANKLLR